MCRTRCWNSQFLRWKWQRHLYCILVHGHFLHQGWFGWRLRSNSSSRKGWQRRRRRWILAYSSNCWFLQDRSWCFEMYRPVCACVQAWRTSWLCVGPCPSTVSVPSRRGEPWCYCVFWWWRHMCGVDVDSLVRIQEQQLVPVHVIQLPFRLFCGLIKLWRWFQSRAAGVHHVLETFRCVIVFIFLLLGFFLFHFLSIVALLLVAKWSLLSCLVFSFPPSIDVVVFVRQFHHVGIFVSGCKRVELRVKLPTLFSCVILIPTVGTQSSLCRVWSHLGLRKTAAPSCCGTICASCSAAPSTIAVVLRSVRRCGSSFWIRFVFSVSAVRCRSFRLPHFSLRWRMRLRWGRAVRTCMS